MMLLLQFQLLTHVTIITQATLTNRRHLVVKIQVVHLALNLDMVRILVR